MSVFVAIPVMLLLLLLKGLFSGSEIALVNADKIRLKRMAKSGHKGSQMVLKAFEHPDELLSNTLIGTNIATIALTTIGTLQMVQLVGVQGDLWAFILFTPLFLIVGEIVPKSIFQDKADLLTPILIYPLVAVSKVFWPVIFVFSRIARLAAQLAGSKNTRGLLISREQLSEVVKLAENSGALGTLNKGQLRRVLSFCDTPVSQVMIPIKDVISFEMNTPTLELIHQSLDTQHYRFPIFDSNPTNIMGLVVMRSWDMLEPTIVDQPLDKLIRPALYVTTRQSLDEILPQIRDRSETMAIVLNDIGAAVGIVSFEDILSIAIGDVNIGHDLTDPRHQRLDTDFKDDGSIIVDGHMPIIKLNQLIGDNVFSTRLNSVNSIILEKTHLIPQPGVVVASSGYELTVEDADERMIKRVRFRKLQE